MQSNTLDSIRKVKRSFADIASEQLRRPIGFRVLGRLRKTTGNLEEIISNEKVRMLYARKKCPASAELKAYKQDNHHEETPKDNKQKLLPKKLEGNVKLSTSDVFNNKHKLNSHLWEERYVQQSNSYAAESHKRLKQKSLSETKLKVLPKYPLLKSHSDSRIIKSFELPKFPTCEKDRTKQRRSSRLYSSSSFCKVPLFDLKRLQVKDCRENKRSRRTKESKRVRISKEPTKTHFYD